MAVTQIDWGQRCNILAPDYLTDYMKLCGCTLINCKYDMCATFQNYLPMLHEKNCFQKMFILFVKYDVKGVIRWLQKSKLPTLNMFCGCRYN